MIGWVWGCPGTSPSPPKGVGNIDLGLSTHGPHRRLRGGLCGAGKYRGWMHLAAAPQESHRSSVGDLDSTVRTRVLGYILKWYLSTQGLKTRGGDAGTPLHQSPWYMLGSLGLPPRPTPLPDADADGARTGPDAGLQ